MNDNWAGNVPSKRARARVPLAPRWASCHDRSATFTCRDISQRTDMADSAPSSVSPTFAPGPHTGNLMVGKRGVIMGAANNRSLGWGIAEACAAQGAELAFTYQGEALERRVRPLAASIGSDFLVNCDVAEEASIDTAFKDIATRWDRIDF